VAHDAGFKRAPGLAQLLPVGYLLYRYRALGADSLGGLAEVAPELGVVEAGLRGLLE
jgi:hypothetical protein